MAIVEQFWGLLFQKKEIVCFIGDEGFMWKIFRW
jgi:hypothetical protein